MEIGRVYTKLTGKDAGKKCVVVEIIDNNSVLIDGNVKRRKCNPKHLEPTTEKIEIEKGASTDQVKHGLNKIGLLKERYISKIKRRDRKGKHHQKEAAKAKKEKKTIKKKPTKKKTESEVVEESLAKV